MARSDLRSWAIKGAEQRLIEIAEETRGIHRTFPELRGRSRAAGSSQGRGANSAQSQDGPPKPRRRKMSAAARKRISDAQKARWAKQRTLSSKGRRNDG